MRVVHSGLGSESSFWPERNILYLASSSLWNSFDTEYSKLVFDLDVELIHTIVRNVPIRRIALPKSLMPDVLRTIVDVAECYMLLHTVCVVVDAEPGMPPESPTSDEWVGAQESRVERRWELEDTRFAPFIFDYEMRDFQPGLADGHGDQAFVEQLDKMMMDWKRCIYLQILEETPEIRLVKAVRR
jgi:hypothetical protein